jgi:3-hydroxyisobutyrate dehydrogenase-like beta-hydroxyacid dehydrogenase
MGGPIAKRWLDAGHMLIGFNRTRAKADKLIAAGMQWANTPRQVAEAAEIIFSMVSDTHALEAIARGPDGVVAGLAPGKIFVDMSTVSPATIRELAKEVRARGADMLDAPVSGSIPAINAGTLTFMVGGSAETLKRVEPLLLQIGNKITHMGDIGTAALMKIAINLSLPIQLLAAYERRFPPSRGQNRS